MGFVCNITWEMWHIRSGLDKVTTFSSVLQVPILVLALHEYCSQHVGICSYLALVVNGCISLVWLGFSNLGGCKILIPHSGKWEVWLTNWKVRSPEILGMEEDLVLWQIATAKDLSNTPEGGVSLKE